MMFWHRLTFPCPRDGVDIKISEILGGADGEMIFEGICPICELTWKFKTDMERILKYCELADNHGNEAIKGKPLKPPLALPPPQITEDDKALMRGMHIEMEGL